MAEKKQRRRRKSTFGTAFKLPSGRYRAQYFGRDGRRYKAPTTFLTEQDARGWLSLRQAEIIADTWMPPEAEKPASLKLTFGDYAEQWMSTRDLKDRTRGDYQKIIDHHLRPAFGTKPLRSITPDDVRTWHAKLRAQLRTQAAARATARAKRDTGTAKSTAPKYDGATLTAHAYGLLRTMMASAAADGLIDANPCTIRGAGSAKRVRQIRPATLPELQLITAAMPEKYRLMVMLSSWCGLRFGEVTELRRRDLDLENETVRIERAVVRVDGGFLVTTPKSDAGTRDVALPPHLLPMIQHHLDAFVSEGNDALLFPAQHGGHLAPSALYRHFYTARTAAGRDDLRWHDLRHTGATLAAATGATLRELMGRLGHSTPGAAMRYQHIAAGRDREIAGLLSQLAAGE